MIWRTDATIAAGRAQAETLTAPEAAVILALTPRLGHTNVPFQTIAEYDLNFGFATRLSFLTLLVL